MVGAPKKVIDAKLDLVEAREECLGLIDGQKGKIDAVEEVGKRRRGFLC